MATMSAKEETMEDNRPPPRQRKRLHAAPGELVTLLNANGVWSGTGLSHVVVGAVDRIEVSVLHNTLSVYVGTPSYLDLALSGSAMQRILMRPGMISLSPAGISVAAGCGAPLEWLTLALDRRFHTHAWGMALDGVELMPSGTIESPLLSNLVCALRADAAKGCPEGPLYGESLLTAMSAYLVRWHGRRRPRRSASGPGLPAATLNLIVSRIQDKMEDGPSLAELAQSADMDPYTFLRKFKKSTGQTPHQYLITARIARAKDLLRSTSLPLTEIALQCGFASPSHFADTFRKLSHMTPQRYRSQISAHHTNP